MNIPSLRLSRPLCSSASATGFEQYAEPGRSDGACGRCPRTEPGRAAELDPAAAAESDPARDPALVLERAAVLVEEFSTLAAEFLAPRRPYAA